MTKKGSTKIIYFMTHRIGVLALRCGHISHIVKMQYFFSSCPHWDMDQPNEVYSNIMKTKENCKFHDPWGWGYVKSLQ